MLLVFLSGPSLAKIPFTDLKKFCKSCISGQKGAEKVVLTY